MGTWTHFEEDSYRLPEGVKRIGYDADTQIYTFQDRDGKLYKGEPGSDYGVLTPMESISIGLTRAGAFDSGGQQRSGSPVSPASIPSTFHDILPATSITSTKSPVDKPLLSTKSTSSSSSSSPPTEGGRSSTRSRFVEAVRKSAIPRMQGVVHGLRRSVTTARPKGHSAADRENLLPRGSSGRSRSMSLTTTRSDRSARDSDTNRVRRRGSRDLNRSDSMATTCSDLSIQNVKQ